MNCDDLIDIEETTLEFLRDNIGDSTTFRPACAYVDEGAIDAQIARSANGAVAEATALRIEVTYTTTEAFEGRIKEKDEQRRQQLERAQRRRGGHGRDLQVRGALCGTANHHLCCTQQSINVDGGGAFCRSTGCDSSDCKKPGGARPPPPVSGRPGGPPGRPGVTVPGGGRPPPRMRGGTAARDDAAGRELQGRAGARPPPRGSCAKGKLGATSFIAAIRRRTAFKTSEKVQALLNDTETSLVAQCSVNWYIITKGGIPSVTCDEYEGLGCESNQDLEFGASDVTCLEPSAAPSSAPSETPSTVPTAVPSAVPSEVPSAVPSASAAPSSQPSASMKPSSGPSASAGPSTSTKPSSSPSASAGPSASPRPSSLLNRTQTNPTPEAAEDGLFLDRQ